MSSMINKRSRSTNWSEEDKKVLRKLVLERAHILENKDTSTNTNTAKKLAWEDVLSCYNIISLHKRDLSQIQNQWRNMKNRAKASEHNFRKARNMTGGGPPPPSPPPEDQELIAALPNEFVVDNNPFDSDTTHDQQEVTKEAGDDSLESTAHAKPDLPNSTELPRITKPTHHFKAKPKKTGKSNSNYEHQLFLLAKKSREELMKQQQELHLLRMEQERELHEKRLQILVLEEEYLKKKIINLEK
ncbi:uncharacterized protein LOC123702518 [Colias croceus]|uniref:uncharacterized protein LOC123702518 n=1 Tax=Colias crocea TaxID=72248 RepID=UPI001E27FD7C|nr:uncharacterized protein LOC123702518 [Colias croceus]